MLNRQTKETLVKTTWEKEQRLLVDIIMRVIIFDAEDVVDTHIIRKINNARHVALVKLLHCEDMHGM